jgi:c-di-GMP-binding flagellar brake protein YcgR
MLEFDDDGISDCTAGYYARVLTASPDSIHELVLLRAASLNREELRTNLRVPTDIPLTVETNGLPNPVSGKLLNISAGGAYFETGEFTGQNGRSTVQIQMTEEPALRVGGTIIHVEEVDAASGVKRIGVRFSGISPEESRAISWYVWSRVRSFFQDNG